MKVVLDTNVLLSGLMVPKGMPFAATRYERAELRYAIIAAVGN